MLVYNCPETAAKKESFFQTVDYFASDHLELGEEVPLEFTDGTLCEADETLTEIRLTPGQN